MVAIKQTIACCYPAPFEDWVGGRLSLCLAADGADKCLEAPEIKAFGQKERTATLIRFVSKLRFLFGGGGGSRTPVRKHFLGNLSGRRRLFLFPRHAANRHAAWVGSFMGHAGGKAYPGHVHH